MQKRAAAIFLSALSLFAAAFCCACESSEASDSETEWNASQQAPVDSPDQNGKEDGSGGSSDSAENADSGQSSNPPQDSDGETTAGGLLYRRNPDGKSYSVAGLGEDAGKEIEIPSYYGKLPVTAIADSAFEGSAIEKAVLPDTLETIGKSAFSGSGIRFIDIPAGVRIIGAGAFYGCDNLTEVVFVSRLWGVEERDENGSETGAALDLSAELSAPDRAAVLLKEIYADRIWCAY